MSRTYRYDRVVTARCTACDKQWEGKNAQGVAARHTDSTGHETTVDIILMLRYFLEREEEK